MREEVLTKKPGDQVSGLDCELTATLGMALSASHLNFSPFHCLLRCSVLRPSHATDMNALGEEKPRGIVIVITQWGEGDDFPKA